MINSIYVAMSGLSGHQRGLEVISDNVANMSTAGFKGATVDFANVFGGAPDGNPGNGGSGGGVAASRTVLDLKAGELQQTGRDLDLALKGSGFFVVNDASGEQRYTRDGAFEFDAGGTLVSRTSGAQVLARNGDGKLAPLEITGLRMSAPKATSQISFSGNLSSTATEHAIDPLTVYDPLGASHALRIEFNPDEAADAPDDSWLVNVLEAGQQIGSGSLKFEGGRVVPESSSMKLSLTLNGSKTPADLTLAFGDDVTSFSSGTTSTLVLQKQDGYQAGTITSLKFDASGTLKVGYSNGETADGQQLALAQLPDDASVQSLGASLFAYHGSEPALVRTGGDDLIVEGQSLEASNVDLTQQFSALILMQRGYQASSQVISTANDMLQELFDMKGR